ncbi:hypothetical protein PGT21_033070 [Puccinia graminis f. sp. tritici]|nr:hypothetical protein PGT21_033070 [Puccinia graminis f. sp. tritici]
MLFKTCILVSLALLVANTSASTCVTKNKEVAHYDTPRCSGKKRRDPPVENDQFHCAALEDPECCDMNADKKYYPYGDCVDVKR